MAYKVKKCNSIRGSGAYGACLTCVALLLLLPSVAAAQGNKLTVAAAADLQLAMRDLQAEFERETGAELTVIYGSSGNLFNQIGNGAPYDVFMSADMDYPRKLISEHLADANSLYRYAVGRLVLWTSASSPVDVSKGMDAVLDPGVSKLAIANPRHAPYGRAAVEALKYYKLYSRVMAKLVDGENVGQAAQFVESGNAQIGFLPLAYVFAPEVKAKGRYFEVPISAYPALDQGMVMVSRTANRALAQRFLDYMQRESTGQLLKRYGFVRPPKSLGQTR